MVEEGKRQVKFKKKIFIVLFIKHVIKVRGNIFIIAEEFTLNKKIRYIVNYF